MGRASTANQPALRQVYFIEAVGLRMVKIGLSDNAEKRLGTLQTASPVDLRLMGVLNVEDAPAYEWFFHTQFREEWIRGEWFRLSRRIKRAAKGLLPPGVADCPILHRPGGDVSVIAHGEDTPEGLAQRVAIACAMVGRPLADDDVFWLEPSPTPVSKVEKEDLR